MLFLLPRMPFLSSPGYFLLILQELAPPGIIPELPAAVGQGWGAGTPLGGSAGNISRTP